LTAGCAAGLGGIESVDVWTVGTTSVVVELACVVAPPHAAASGTKTARAAIQASREPR
jgi:hypothetical protein